LERCRLIWVCHASFIGKAEGPVVGVSTKLNRRLNP
jgi:hypothetical protein